MSARRGVLSPYGGAQPPGHPRNLVTSSPDAFVTPRSAAERYRLVMANRTAERRACEQIESICASRQDVTSLRVDVLEVIRTVVDFDAHVWLVTDPGPRWAAAPLAVIPCLPELALTIRLKYLTDVKSLDQAGPGGHSRWHAAPGDGSPAGP